MAQPGGRPPVLFLLQAAVGYVSHMFRVFGLIDPHPALGFGVAPAAAGGAATAAGEGGAEASFEGTVGPFLDRLAGFREKGGLGEGIRPPPR